MQDRSPKHPGRVKLLPVAGQENIYDMTRADEPDDTGTPFNKRTMLQDSTAQLLKLPLANPFPDDALRHMVDRIVPIGTIRTSPAQSLGDAWLKCDGSMVTFENYPQLCSVLRNTGGAVTWDTNAFPSTYTDIFSASDPVYFDGKWMVAISSLNSWVKILSASSLDGTWTEEASFASDAKSDVWLSASDNYCVCAFLTYYTGTQGAKLQIKVKAKDAEEWNEIEPPNAFQFQYTDSSEIRGLDHCGGRFAILVYKYISGGSKSTFIAYSDAPESSEGWTLKENLSSGFESLSCIGTEWFAVSGEYQKSGSSATVEITFWKADDISLFTFQQWATYAEKVSANYTYRMYYPSKVTYYSGYYYFMACIGYSSTGVNGYITPTIYRTADFSKWKTTDTDSVLVSGMNRFHTAASEIMVALAGGPNAWTTANPDVGYSDISIPNMPVQGLAVKGALVIASAKTGIAYHDYTYDSRLLPKISLSSDTTTFIKAKNELDVFEAGGD